jgi:hypothetical protein
MRDRWATLAASAPVNRDAATGAFGGGAAYAEPGNIMSEWHWPSPPPLARVTRGGIDLTGLRVGRLHVIGLLQRDNNRQPGVWVCRCTCGDYCGRKAKALRNPDAKPETMMCQRCEHTQRIQFHGTISRERAERGSA